jgi:hypothetical protein
MPERIESDQSLPPSGNMLSRLTGIFYAPKGVFTDVDRGAPWWEPWIWASIVNMIVSYVVVPVQVQLYRVRGDGLSGAQLEEAIEKMQAFPWKYVGVATAPVTVLFVAVLFSAVSYIAVSALSERAGFKKHLSICLWASIVWWVGVLASTLIVRARGIEEIRTMRDAMAPFGPAAVVTDANRIWLAVLSTLDVFAVWFYVLVAVGVMHVFRMSGRAALLVVIPIWLLFVLFELISAGMAAGA